MVEAIKEIGKIEFDKIKSDDKLLEIFTEDLSSSGYVKALEIMVSLDDDVDEFNKVNFREYDDNLKLKYLYRAGSSRGTDITPTAKITDVDKTFENKLLKGFIEAIDNCNECYESEKNLLGRTLAILINNENEIKDQAKAIFEKTSIKDRKFVLTVVLKNLGNEMYIGDFDVFKRQIRDIPLKKFRYSKTQNKDVFGKDVFCSICRERKDEVFGLASPYKFYTIDKPGYISGGFNYEDAWRNYPVCADCAMCLEMGKSYVDENLVLSFYGRRFYLVPKVIFNQELEKVLLKYKRIFKSDSDAEKTKQLSNEDRILRALSDEENSITFDLMFFEVNKAALNITLNIEDVYPSTFKRLYSEWEDIKAMGFFSNIQYLANFGYLNMIFDNKTYNRYFLDTVDNIIGKGRVEYNFIITFINQELREAFVREEVGESASKNVKKGEKKEYKDNYNVATLRAYTFIYYLYRLGKFKNRGKEGVKDMEREIWKLKDFGSKSEVFQDYFNSNDVFFDSDSKKAVFMIGYLSRKLLNLQASQENGRTPFISKLNGLNINKKDMLRLMPAIQGKLMEYKKEFYNEEITQASVYLIDSNNLADLSNRDIPLYFSLGMNMSKRFQLNSKLEEEKDND